MGNHSDGNNADLIEDPDQLIEGNDNAGQQNNNSPQIKTIIKIKNPFYLLKETIHLEKDSIKNIYYIKFLYDSLINFDCYINFNVRKNTERKNLKQNDDYELCYIPTDKFVEKNIVIKNMPKGRKKEFFEENAVLDFDYLEQNTTRIKEIYEEYEDENEEEETDNEINNQENYNDINNDNNNTNNQNQNEENEALININNNNINNEEENKENVDNNEENIEYEEIFDICIEFSPNYDDDLDEKEKNINNNEIALISLFSVEKKENNELEIKCVAQKLKKHNYFFDIKDIYDGSGNNGKCIICYTNDRDTIFLECRHSCCCQQCSNTLMPKICPLCKIVIQDIIYLKEEEKDNTNALMNPQEEDIISNGEIDPINDIL